MQDNGLKHIRNLKQDAMAIWQCYDCQVDYWKQCILIAMKNHRLFLLARQEKEKQESHKEVESLWNGNFVD